MLRLLLNLNKAKIYFHNIKDSCVGLGGATLMTDTTYTRIYSRLSPAEQDMLFELLLASGSLKSLAERYGVSYPTIRARLDRLIARVEELQADSGVDQLAHKLADLIEVGSMQPQAAREVLELHRTILESAQSGQENA